MSDINDLARPADRVGHERSQSTLSPPDGDHPSRGTHTPAPWCHYEAIM